jgi:hypothetical protein
MHGRAGYSIFAPHFVLSEWNICSLDIFELTVVLPTRGIYWNCNLPNRNADELKSALGMDATMLVWTSIV